MKGRITRIIGCILILAIFVMWLKEYSQRLAREKADNFLGPFRTQLTCIEMRLRPWSVNTAGRLTGPTWVVRYVSDLTMIDFPPEIRVTVFGDVSEVSTLNGLYELIGLPDEVRYHRELMLLDS